MLIASIYWVIFRLIYAFYETLPFYYYKCRQNSFFCRTSECLDSVLSYHDLDADIFDYNANAFKGELIAFLLI